MIPGLGRSEGYPVFWPGELHGLYIDHWVTNFHFTLSSIHGGLSLELPGCPGFLWVHSLQLKEAPWPGAEKSAGSEKLSQSGQVQLSTRVRAHLPCGQVSLGIVHLVAGSVSGVACPLSLWVGVGGLAGLGGPHPWLWTQAAGGSARPGWFPGQPGLGMVERSHVTLPIRSSETSAAGAPGS